MFRNKEELARYIFETFPEVTDSRVDDDQWDLECSECKVTRGFQVVQHYTCGSRTEYERFSPDSSAPTTYVFRCPVCHAFKQWIIYEHCCPAIS